MVIEVVWASKLICHWCHSFQLAAKRPCHPLPQVTHSCSHPHQSPFRSCSWAWSNGCSWASSQGCRFAPLRHLHYPLKLLLMSLLLVYLFIWAGLYVKSRMDAYLQISVMKIQPYSSFPSVSTVPESQIPVFKPTSYSCHFQSMSNTLSAC